MAISKIESVSLNSGVPNASNLPSGSVVQVVQRTHNVRAVVNSAAYKVNEHNIITTVANSKILVIISAAIGGVDSYSDSDLALAIGYKVGSTGSASTDYTSVHTSQYSRQTISGLGSFFASDTQRSAGSGGIYWSEEKTYLKLISPNQAANSNIYVSFWAGSDATYYLGSPSGSTADDGGSEMSMTLMEIAP